MAAVFASCQKMEISGDNAVSNDFQLNISVADPCSDNPVTRAYVKTGWANGDKINIWYDTNKQDNPDLVIEYDGTKWKKAEGVTLSGNNPSQGESKYAKAVYSGNVTVVSKDNYSYDGSTLSFSIANWTFLTEIQVVVTGLTYESNKTYMLACDKLAIWNGYSIGETAISAKASYTNGDVSGISNSEGIAFVFKYAYGASETDNYVFTLYDGSKSKIYTASSKSLSGKTTDKIYGIKLNYSNFTDPVSPSGSTGSDSGSTHSWVQLSENGPKWAEFNVGSTITSYANVTEYTTTNVGGMYHWCGSTPNDRRDSGVTTCDDSTSSTYSNEIDTAHKLWGDSWIMPTYAQMLSLTRSCTWTWCDGQAGDGHLQYASGCTLAGWKVSGRGNYAANSIFLPVAGHFKHAENPALSDCGTVGLYWAIDTNDSTDKTCLRLDATSRVYKVLGGYYASSVRAVLKESGE